MVEQDGTTQTTPERPAERHAEQGSAARAPEAERAYQSMEELLEQEQGFPWTADRRDHHGHRGADR